jgi:hypothetical protein
MKKVVSDLCSFVAFFHSMLVWIYIGIAVVLLGGEAHSHSFLPLEDLIKEFVDQVIDIDHCGIGYIQGKRRGENSESPAGKKQKPMKYDCNRVEKCEMTDWFGIFPVLDDRQLREHFN